MPRIITVGFTCGLPSFCLPISGEPCPAVSKGDLRDVPFKDGAALVKMGLAGFACEVQLNG